MIYASLVCLVTCGCSPDVPAACLHMSWRLSSEPDVCVVSRNSSLKPKGMDAQDALLELKELGPLGIPLSSPSSPASNPFATELVLAAFTDVPAVPSGMKDVCRQQS